MKCKTLLYLPVFFKGMKLVCLNILQGQMVQGAIGIKFNEISSEKVLAGSVEITCYGHGKNKE